MEDWEKGLTKKKYLLFKKEGMTASDTETYSQWKKRLEKRFKNNKKK